MNYDLGELRINYVYDLNMDRAQRPCKAMEGPPQGAKGFSLCLYGDRAKKLAAFRQLVCCVAFVI